MCGCERRWRISTSRSTFMRFSASSDARSMDFRAHFVLAISCVATRTCAKLPLPSFAPTRYEPMRSEAPPLPPPPPRWTPTRDDATIIGVVAAIDGCVIIGDDGGATVADVLGVIKERKSAAASDVPRPPNGGVPAVAVVGCVVCIV